MSRRDPEVAIAHMRQHAAEAVEMACEASRERLGRDRTLELALTRLVEIIGEAASRVPEGDRSAWPSIPWRSIIAMRNRLIHGYDEVDLDVLWDVVRADLPELLAALDGVTRNDQP